MAENRFTLASGPALLVRGMIRLYQFTFSFFVGRTCRYLPTCSDYTDEAIRLHGAWAGLWMGVARIGRCRPGGGHGWDPTPVKLPIGAVWYLPWTYGQWRPPGDPTEPN